MGMVLRAIKVDTDRRRMIINAVCPKCKYPSLDFDFNLDNIQSAKCECCNQVKFLGRNRALDIFNEYLKRTLSK